MFDRLVEVALHRVATGFRLWSSSTCCDLLFLKSLSRRRGILWCRSRIPRVCSSARLTQSMISPLLTYEPSSSESDRTGGSASSSSMVPIGAGGPISSVSSRGRLLRCFRSSTLWQESARLFSTAACAFFSASRCLAQASSGQGRREEPKLSQRPVLSSSQVSSLFSPKVLRIGQMDCPFHFFVRRRRAERGRSFVATLDMILLCLWASAKEEKMEVV
mmetsp:Transcript_8146/g.13808  ORF Transcript_8146/g.13808 Transcript_8146/m.13808 type:complete len:218 (+) Transcript_8146:351-1004(+)